MVNTDYNLENAADVLQGGGRSAAIRARKKAYQEYMDESTPFNLTNDLDLAALNLEYERAKSARRGNGVVSGSGTFTPEEDKAFDDSVFESEDETTMSLIKDGVNSLLIDMNSTQLSSARGKLVRSVLPELQKLNEQKSIFDEYQKVNSQLSQYETQEGFEVNKNLPKEYFQLKRYNDELATQLRSLGVLPDGSNFQIMYEANNKAISDLKSNEAKLRESIAEDEADLARYSVSSQYQEQKDSKEPFQFSDPSKWIYKLPGVLGSSSSSFAWQVAPYVTTMLKSQAKKGLIKIAASSAAGTVVPGAGNLVGAAVGTASAAMDLANYGMMIYSNFKQSENEADAEVYDNYKQRVRGTLEANGVDSNSLVATVRNNPNFKDKYKDYTDEQVFDKILDGEIKFKT